MIRPVAAALALALAAGGAHAQTSPAPAPIRDFDLATIERLGRAIWRQDAAAARATDALLKQVPDPAKAKIVGWVVDEDGDGARVRFVRDLGSGPEAAYDVEVPARGAPRVTTPADRALSAGELARLRARAAAGSSVTRVCRPRYNTAVLKDVDGDGWLVWLLAPSPAAGVIPVGGHYRVTVSEDGRTVERRDALSNTCLAVDPRQGVPKGAQPVGVVASHLVSATPIETHVFLNHLYRLPVYVSTGTQLWRVANGKIEKVRR